MNGKPSSPVLRGLGASDGARLLDSNPQTRFAGGQVVNALHIPSSPGLRPCLYGQFVVNWDDNHRERRSCVVAQLWEQAAELVAAQHRIVVIWSEDHHVGMPVADSGTQILIRGPHVSKTDAISLRQFAFGIRGLNTFDYLLRCLALHSKVAAQLAEAGVPGIAALPAPLRPRNGSSSPAHPGLLA